MSAKSTPTVTGHQRIGPKAKSEYDRDMRRTEPAIILDTNVFVSALFNPESDSARICDAVRSGRLRMIWNDATQRETRSVLEMIPPLSWRAVEGLFRDENRFARATDASRFQQISDPEDRKFAALAHATGSILISQDADLLAHPYRFDVLVLTPSEFATGEWASVEL